MMTRLLPLLCAFALACESEIDNKTAAEVAPAAPPAEAPPAAEPPPAEPAAPAAPAEAPAGAWKMDAASTIEWVGAKVTKDHPGGFKVLNGHATVADGKLSAATVTIDLNSLFSDNEKLTVHLKDADFFDVAKFPSSTFTITSVDAGTVKGTLDLHGVQKEISFPATVEVTEAGARIQAEFTLNRKDFGIAYAGKPDDLIRDEVLVKGALMFKP
jgi:polyisoprenoid-binding protein YceI